MFDESEGAIDSATGSPAPPAQTPRKSNRLAVAAFFIGLNALILLVWLNWPASDDRGRSGRGSLDAAAPFEEPNKPQPVRREAPPLRVDDDAPEDAKEESRRYNQAHLKLQLANRWKLTHPEKARKFAQEAVDLAPPGTDVAEEARQLLRLLR